MMKINLNEPAIFIDEWDRSFDALTNKQFDNMMELKLCKYLVDNLHDNHKNEIARIDQVANVPKICNSQDGMLTYIWDI